MSGAPLPSDALPAQYRPGDHEPAVRARWAERGAFHADPGRVLRGEARPFAVLIPPPNVTDRLHLGHALNNTLQDIVVRYHRMCGFETLWMPGTDHAGIATQAVVERRLQKDEGKRRTDFTREAFVARVQAFKDEYEATITRQLIAMGCSCDWERQRFTMDEFGVRAVNEAFFRLFREGLIYRGKRLVNWDPALQTAIADDEVEPIEIEGAFYYLRYPLVHAGAPGMLPTGVTWDELARRGYPGAEAHPGSERAWITVATTRPETYLGDTAVAVNPRDPRAGALRGLHAQLPLVGRVIPIVPDDYVVMPSREGDGEPADPKARYATGFLKVTPAHDTNDYEIGRRHGLPVINVMAPDASISNQHGWSDVGDAHIFAGLSREAARVKVIGEFRARGLLEGTRPYRHTVGHSDRSKAAIEPYLSDQWYVRVTDDRLRGAALRAMAPAQRTSEVHAPADAPGDGQLVFHPERYARTYEVWHEQLRDWCISRQLWWGHRIPVWRGPAASLPPAVRDWERDGLACVQPLGDGVGVCLRSAGDRAKADALDRAGFEQDPDVLDTWFSSALWPMSTMGWPEPPDAMRGLLRAFNPTSTLFTAREIITLWVSRMVMFNRFLMPEGWPASGGTDAGPVEPMGRGRGPLPFRDVFIHAVIQDGDGRKMSKSLGNGVDPLDIIASHGADAMRFTLCHMTTNLQDVRMPVERDEATGRNTSPKFDLGRNFCSKVWNAARFALGKLSDGDPAVPARGWDQLLLADRWMLSRLTGAMASLGSSLDRFEFSAHAQGLYDLVWRDFCDWYLEAVKPTVGADPMQRAVLASVLRSIVRLLHPVAPFITEVLFERVEALSQPAVPGLELGTARCPGVLATAGWPRTDGRWADAACEARFDELRALVEAIRQVRAQHGVRVRRRITLHATPAWESAIRASGPLVEAMADVGTVTCALPGAGVPFASFTIGADELQLSDLADGTVVDTDAERARLAKHLADLARTISTLEGRLGNAGYIAKAPARLVDETRAQLAKTRAEHEAAEAALARLG